MRKQPEALRLADSLDNYAEPHNCNEDAAAELRRLHAANVELLEALKGLLPIARGGLMNPDLNCEVLNAHEAIEKHGSQS